MKAGVASSSPDNGTKSVSPISVAFSKLLDDIGEATTNINSLVVGLDAVEQGYPKPIGLDISWNPVDRSAAARKARKFAVEAVLVRASEAINQYVSAISVLPRFGELREGWRMARSQPSNAQKIEEISYTILATDKDYLVPAVLLLVHWRNRIVHENSTASLKPQQKRLLQESEDEIGKRYKALSIDCLLCHFQEQRPTLKDVSSLISMTLNLARKLDLQVHECKSREDVAAWLDHYRLMSVIDKVMSTSAPGKVEESVRRIFRTSAPQLADAYFAFYYPRSTDRQ